jgi:hypothetical protein
MKKFIKEWDTFQQVRFFGPTMEIRVIPENDGHFIDVILYQDEMSCVQNYDKGCGWQLISISKSWGPPQSKSDGKTRMISGYMCPILGKLLTKVTKFIEPSGKGTYWNGQCNLDQGKELMDFLEESYVPELLEFLNKTPNSPGSPLPTYEVKQVRIHVLVDNSTGHGMKPDDVRQADRLNKGAGGKNHLKMRDGFYKDLGEQ